MEQQTPTVLTNDSHTYTPPVRSIFNEENEE